MARGPRVRKIGEIAFTDLPEDTQDDVVSALRYLSWRDSRHIERDLQNGPAILPVVEVNPAAIFNPDRPVDAEKVKEYTEEFEGGNEFPPVVIDSSRAPFLALVEGGHRTKAATQAKVKKIPAIDVAGYRLIELSDGEWTSDFKYARRP
jgi:ParB-like nuclease family protein